MTIIDILILFLIIFGIVGSGWLIIAGVVYIYGKIENFFYKRRIPDKIRKEVQDDRFRREATKEDFRRKYAGTGNPEVERTFESARAGIDNNQPKELQQISNDYERDIIGGSSETQRRDESTRRSSGWRRI